MRAAVLGMAFALSFGGVATADVAPDPDEMRDILADIIRQRGIACVAVSEFHELRGGGADRLRSRGYGDIQVAQCRDGPAVLVARGRRHGRYPPAVQPIIRVLSRPGVR